MADDLPHGAGPLTDEERYMLRLHVTKIGEPLLDRLLFEHDRMAATLKRRRRQIPKADFEALGTHEMGRRHD